MAKTWYPVIDYLACIECGTCVAKCPNGVYDVKKAPSPVVLNPGACIDYCHGCGNRCPAGAITYVGDNTGWTPPNSAPESGEPCCSCGCESPGKKVLIDYLYLDLQTCDRCIGTDKVLDEVLLTLTPALSLSGYTVEYKKTEMKTAEIAKQYEFLSSPTVRVNGRDICSSVKESSCGCCGEISGTDVSCRVFEYNGEGYEVPPKEMLSEAILKAVFGEAESKRCTGGFKLSENLKAFYEGKDSKSSCSCGGNCR